MRLNKLAKYLIITYLISWIIWGILIILVNNGVTTSSGLLGVIILAVGGFGPTIAAIVLQEKITLKSIRKYIFGGNHRAVPYLLLFCILLTVVIGLSSMELQPDLPLYLFPVYWIIMTVLIGGNEELGWRGFMQPFLEKSVPFPIAVLITSITWSAWHLPLWLVEGSSQQTSPFIIFAAFGLILSFSMAAIHKKTKCVFYSAVFHGLSNTLMAYFVVGANLIIIFGGIFIIIISLLIWYIDKRKSIQRI